MDFGIESYILRIALTAIIATYSAMYLLSAMFSEPSTISSTHTVGNTTLCQAQEMLNHVGTVCKK